MKGILYVTVTAYKMICGALNSTSLNSVM